jgi:hypothetical protein
MLTRPVVLVFLRRMIAALKLCATVVANTMGQMAAAISTRSPTEDQLEDTGCPLMKTTTMLRATKVAGRTTLQLAST